MVTARVRLGQRHSPHQAVLGVHRLTFTVHRCTAHRVRLGQRHSPHQAVLGVQNLAYRPMPVGRQVPVVRIKQTSTLRRRQIPELASHVDDLQSLGLAELGHPPTQMILVQG